MHAIQRFLAFSIISLLFSVSANAQSQFAGWYATFNTFRINKKLSIHNDIQWRSNNQVKHLQTFLLRAGLNIHLNKKMIATVGYAHIQNRRVIAGVDGYVPEHRIWEQFIYNHRPGPLFLQHRFRLEQRFLGQPAVDNQSLNTTDYKGAQRVRYFLRGILPFQKKKPSFDKGMYGAFQNELFINFGNKANVNGEDFDQNRFYIGSGYRLSKKFDVELGYMNQYINGRATAFSNFHIAQLSTFIRL